MPVTLLDGPLGTELNARGVSTELPAWSAGALETAPAVVEAIHRDYRAAGATVHTTNTFRTREREIGPRWATLARTAVALARAAAGEQRVAGSIAPLSDCYRPDLSPPHPFPEHRALAELLAGEGVDLLLCETFPHVGEAHAAAEAALSTGLPVWVALTAGPDADLMTPGEMASAARSLAALGAAAVLVNCVPASRTLAYVRAIAEAGVPFGAYANAGAADERVGWVSADDGGPSRYAAYAREWASAGATIIGSCCGTGPAHIRELARRLGG